MTIADANVDILCDAIKQGLDLQSAGDLAGISPSTLSRWNNSPENDTQLRNGKRMRKAAAEYAQDAIAGITASGARGHEFVLRHSPTYRDRWGDRTDTVTDAAAAALALLAARLPPPPPAASLPAAPLSLADNADE